MRTTRKSQEIKMYLIKFNNLANQPCVLLIIEVINRFIKMDMKKP